MLKYIYILWWTFLHDLEIRSSPFSPRHAAQVKPIQAPGAALVVEHKTKSEKDWCASILPSRMGCWHAAIDSGCLAWRFYSCTPWTLPTEPRSGPINLPGYTRIVVIFVTRQPECTSVQLEYTCSWLSCAECTGSRFGKGLQWSTGAFPRGPPLLETLWETVRPRSAI